MPQVSFQNPGGRDQTIRPPLRGVLCHVVLQSELITAEPWTPAGIIAGVLFLAAVIALIVYLVLRYGGRGN